MSAFRKRLSLVVVAVLAIALVAAGCGGDDDTSATGGGGGETTSAEGGGGGDFTIALLLPENETPRYETNDRPDFEDAVAEKCPECEVIYFNAGGDAEKQQSQGEAALTKGADVMVLDPMDSKSAASIAERANSQGIPVVSYDRLIENAEVDAYISFDNENVGELQAESLSEKLKEDGKAKGPIIMINGDPADPNAALFKAGAKKGFEAAGVEIAKEYDTPGWTAENAQREAQQAITALGNDGFWGIYAANDDTGGGAIAALKGAGINPEERPVTGQDATVAGLQRILAGQQYMTIYKAIPPQAQISAEIAIALAEGGEVPADKVTEEINNGKADVPSVLLEPIAVTKDNVKDTVVKDGFVTASELCTGPYAAACKEAGISG
ncbi:MAG: D-xylose transport system substrate-binding protein [Solirubrobacterales bacterium]|jgi:D-xylose transport system substrate-binding protein|nr:D-xylose transport system substrate-binding protein [Solirubrobacterales bacterium]